MLERNDKCNEVGLLFGAGGVWGVVGVAMRVFALLRVCKRAIKVLDCE